MPKRSIFLAEFYPVMVLRNYESERMAEFTDEEIMELKRIEAEWAAWQIKIAERFGFKKKVRDWEQSE